MAGVRGAMPQDGSLHSARQVMVLLVNKSIAFSRLAINEPFVAAAVVISAMYRLRQPSVIIQGSFDSNARWVTILVISQPQLVKFAALGRLGGLPSWSIVL